MASTPDARPATVTAWRLDRDRHAATWDSGEGAFLFGGRWNSVGTRVVYAALDPATAILEVAAHIGFRVLATVPYVLTAAEIIDASRIHRVAPADIPNAAWLEPGNPIPAQQAFGDALIRQHPLLALRSVVSRHSWNLLIAIPAAQGLYRFKSQEPFRLDPRLAP